MTAKERWERWYAANRERYNAYQRAYWKRRRNRQLLTPEEARQRKLERMKRWRQANPDFVHAGHAAVNANKRAVRWGVSGRLKTADVLAVWARQPACVDCGIGRGVDHVIPMRDGGANEPDNLANRCGCNARKENRARHLVHHREEVPSAIGMP